MHIAARYGLIASIKSLIKKGADREALSDKHKTPLHIAASCDQGQAIECLVENSANIEAIDIEARTPLLLAIEKGNHWAVSLLLKKGATSESAFLVSALHHRKLAITYSVHHNINTIQENYEKIIIALLQHNCPVEDKEDLTSSATSHAVKDYFETSIQDKERVLRIIQLLAFENVDPALKNRYRSYNAHTGAIPFSLYKTLRTQRSQELKDNALYYLLDLLNERDPQRLNIQPNEQDPCKKGLALFFRLPAPELKEKITGYLSNSPLTYTSEENNKAIRIARSLINSV